MTDTARDRLAASAQNARTHSIYAIRPLLQSEDKAAFNALYEAWALTYLPRNPLEREILTDIVNIHWQIRRLRDMEVGNLEMSIARRRAVVDQTWVHLPDRARTCDAMETLANTSKLPSLINRQLSRLNREQERLTKFFQQLRKDFPPVVDPLPTGLPEVKNEGNGTAENDAPRAAPAADDVYTTPEFPVCALRVQETPPPGGNAYTVKPARITGSAKMAAGSRGNW